MSGYIYALSNSAMPDLLKIGRSSISPETRIRQLSSTGVPATFILQCCFAVRDSVRVEKDIHLALAKQRENPNREFFRTTVSEFLRLAIPLVIADLGSSPVSELSKTASHSLSDLEVRLLQVVVNAGEGGANNYMFTWHNPRIEDTEISVTVAIANLHEAKLLKKVRGHDRYDPFWVATPKGIKLLSDNELIADWMR